jgi:hypothetical protein
MPEDKLPATVAVYTTGSVTVVLFTTTLVVVGAIVELCVRADEMLPAKFELPLYWA